MRQPGYLTLEFCAFTASMGLYFFSGYAELSILMLFLLSILILTTSSAHTVKALESEETRQISERYKLLTSNLAASVVLRDETGKITYCSPYTEVLTGYPISEIIPSEDDFFLSVAHDDDKERMRRALKMFELGDPYQFRYRFFHRSGMERWAETRTIPVIDGESSQYSSLSITLDVTGNALYEKQVEARNRDLEDFTYMVTHDLKAPIYTIKGMLQVLKEDFGANLGADANDVLSHIDRAIRRLEQLIQGVLEYSRASKSQTSNTTVDLNTLLKEVIADLGTQISESGALIQVEENLLPVLGDETKLYQVFSNLIGNAIKYRSKDRPLIIQVETETLASRKLLRIAVRDNGMGIPNEKLDLIFRPFQRVHPENAEGTGVGLASVIRLLEKMAGDISVESRVDIGSSFFVTLRKVLD